MKLSKADIKALYGSHLFILPEENFEEAPVIDQVVEEPSEQEVHEETVVEQNPVSAAPAELQPLSKGTPVVWKMRAGAALALVLSEAEFTNKLITNGLKQIVLDAGINPKEIGFGVLSGETEEWDFSDMPVPVAVVFRAIPVKKNPVVLPQGKVHITYPVAEIVMDTHKQQALVKLFSHLNQ